jgi:predicted MFS family arabinose efflux permease
MISTGLGGNIAKYSWILVFLLGMLAHILAAIMVWLMPDDLKQEKTHSNEKFINLNETFSILKNIKFKYIAVMIILTQSSGSIFYLYSAVILKDRNISTQHISWIVAIFSFFGILASIGLHRLENKFDKWKIIKFSLFTGTILYGVLFWNNIIIFLVAYMLIGYFYEIWDTSLNSQLHEVVLDKYRTSSVSLVNTLTALLMAVQSIVIGLFEDKTSILILLIGLISNAIAFFIVFIAKSKISE